MPESKLNVKLLTCTNDPVNVIYVSSRQCYSSDFAWDISRKPVSLQEQESFIKKIIESGHESPLEHVSFTFAVEGISRAATHQLVRHRIASYSQQSQRYVVENDFSYIVPPTIKRNPELLKEYMDFMSVAQKKYDQIIKCLNECGISGEKASQDARFVLPNAAETKIVITMNCRELIHFFGLRCCSRSQWEIFALACEMLKLVKEKLPCVFESAGAKCEKLKYCPEIKKFSCGRYPLKLHDDKK